MKKILIVDDEERLAEVTALGLELSNENFKALFATNGLEAIEMFDFDIDLVITDYRMPRMNGLELAHELKKQKASLIVVLYTGSPLSDDERAVARAAGIDGFLQKPTGIDVLERIICHLLSA